MAAQQEDVAAELEALQAVYADDCVILDSFPPRLHLHIKPRTADVASQQFVEAVIEIRADSQYPEEPPYIDLIDSKGLDEERQKHLTNYIREKAFELSSCLMLVAVCEEAVEKLSAMNHPDGDCPLCLCPLVPEEEQCEGLPFMKLMSCFHCFHSECIIRWWSCIETEAKINASSNVNPRSLRETRDHQDTRGAVKESMGKCPVCRKGFHAQDLEHVLHLIGNDLSQVSLDENEDDDSEKFLQSDAAKVQRENFEAIFKVQQENGGLIERKKNIVIVPGMFLTPPLAPSTSAAAKESPGEQLTEPSRTSSMHGGGSSGRHNTNDQRSYGWRKDREQRVHHPRRPAKQWLKKESDKG